MNKISLTASMRSNLLSLQNISGQVSSTQNKLATGNKVNSAIDNPSSYYTALSLNNRADDLNALLDSMGQAVSTIKAATTALESATEFLEQASAVATQALETAKIPSKSFFEEKVGENGAVVTTAQELRDAITSGKETICIYGAIDLGDISTTRGLELKENQKLVGVGYFGNYDTDTNKFSSITATAGTTNKSVISISQNNSLVSDLSIKHSNTQTPADISTIYINGGGETKQYRITLQNLDIQDDFADPGGHFSTAIYALSYSQVYLEGNINIKNNGNMARGIVSSGYANVNIRRGADVNIESLGNKSQSVVASGQSTVNLEQEANLYIEGPCLAGEYGSVFNIAGNFYIETSDIAIKNSSLGRPSSTFIASTAKLYIFGTDAYFQNFHDAGQGPNVLDIAAGAKMAFEKDGKTEW